MLETIHELRRRIDELEYLNVPDPNRIYLNQPYDSRSQTHSPDLPGKLVSVGSVLVFKSTVLQIWAT